MEFDNRYASRGAGTAGITLGTIGTFGTAANLLGGNLGNLFGGGYNCHENMPVNRYELSMQKEITNKDMEIAYLRSRDAAKTDSLELYRYIDNKFACVERELADQRVYNAVNTSTQTCMQGQIAQLYSLTKLVIPNGSICPGYGEVTVTPVTPTTTTAAG